MTIAYSNVDVTTDTFTTLITRVNQALTALNINIVTTNSNTATGNAAISGTFTASNLVANVKLTAQSATFTSANTIYMGGASGNTVWLVANTTANTLNYVALTTSLITDFATYANTVSNTYATNTSVNTINTNLTANISAINTSLSNKQPIDAQLTALSNTTPSNNTFHYWTDANTAVVATITAQGRALIDDADAATQRATMGVDTELARVEAAAVAYAIALG